VRLWIPTFLIGAFSVLALPVGAQSDADIAAAEAFFNRFAALGESYDPSVASLYADDAVIESVRRYPNGTERTIRLTGVEYKRLIRAAMPLARARGDRDTFSGVSFVPDGDRIRVRCIRYSELKQYASPFELVLMRGGGRWRIVEEYSETRP
jgi:hypothetical protein